MRRVLVTGAGGFIGRHVTAALSSRGFEVHAVASASAEPSRGDECIWHRADLLEPSQRDALVGRVRADALMHLAWCARPPAYWRDPDNLAWLGASLALVRAFAEAGGTRVVGAGTCAEYDWRHGYCTEGLTPVAPTSLYGAAKATCGSMLDAYGRESGLSVAWGRPFFLFGPYDSPARLIPSLATAMTAGQPARCVAGSHVRDYLYVVDAAGALVALLGTAVTGAVNIASGAPVRIADVATRVADRLGRRDLLTIEEGASDNALVAANVTRLRDEVGWRPEHEFGSALDETVRWWSSAAARDGTA